MTLLYIAYTAISWALIFWLLRDRIDRPGTSLDSHCGADSGRRAGVADAGGAMIKICAKPIHRYVAAIEVVEMSGATRSNLYKWLDRRDYRKCPYSRKIGNRLYLLDKVADEYLDADGAPRVAERPRSWISRERAIEISGYSSHWWDRQLAAGRVRAVRWQHILFIHPGDVEAARRRRERRTAPADWVMLSDLAKRHGIGATVLKHRCVALGIRWRIYDHPRTLSDAAYIHESDAAAVLEYGVEQAPPEGWVPYTRLARELGLSHGLVWNWLRRNGYPTVQAMHPDGNRAGWCSPEAWEAYKRASYKLAGRGRWAS